MAWTKICIVFTTISNQWVCRTRLYFYPALFLVFHQREMFDNAVSERIPPPHTHSTSKSKMQWCWTQWKCGCLSAWRTWVLQQGLRNNRQSVRTVKHHGQCFKKRTLRKYIHEGSSTPEAVISKNKESQTKLLLLQHAPELFPHQNAGGETTVWGSQVFLVPHTPWPPEPPGLDVPWRVPLGLQPGPEKTPRNNHFFTKLSVS